MILLKKAMDEKKFDLRILEMQLQNGKITQKEYEAFLNTLPDCSENSVKLQIDDPDMAENQLN